MLKGDVPIRPNGMLKSLPIPESSLTMSWSRMISSQQRSIGYRAQSEEDVWTQAHLYMTQARQKCEAGDVVSGVRNAYGQCFVIADKHVDPGVSRGAVGVILDVYETGDYEVEFSRPNGTTISWFAVHPEAVEPTDGSGATILRRTRD